MEEPLPAGGSCLLGSINLSEYVTSPFTKDADFNYFLFENDMKHIVKSMNILLDEGLPLHPLQEQRDSVRDWRQIGIGIMGLADMLIKLGITYGSELAINISNDIGLKMIDVAIYESSLLAKENGPYPMYNREAIMSSPFFVENTRGYTKELVKIYGLRNSQILTIAPTGTLSTMLGISGGIEPIYANYYTRTTETVHAESKSYKVFTPIVKEYMDKNNIEDDKDLPEYFVTAQILNYKDRIKMQSIWQQHIDAAISSTVNVPYEFTVEEVEDLYMLAYDSGIKGITIYRDGCSRFGILTTKEEPKPIEEIIPQKIGRGFILEASDDLIGRKKKIQSGCGTIHIQAWFDPDTGDMMELFLSKGSQGGCLSNTLGLSRIISLALRGGIPLQTICDQLDSVPSCPAYAIRTVTKKDTSKGNSCPMAIGKIIMLLQTEVYEELGISPFMNKDTYINIEIKKEIEVLQKEIINAVGNDNSCPECGEQLANSGGCAICTNCGTSGCS